MTGTAVSTRRGKGGVVVVEVRGDVEVAETPELRKALLRAVLHGRSSCVVIDLQRAGHLDAVGIGAVIAADQIAADRQLPVVVRGPRPDIAERLRTAGLPQQRIRARFQWPNSHFVMWLV